MKRIATPLLLLLAISLAAATALAEIPVDQYVKGRLIVQFNRDVGLSTVGARTTSTAPGVDRLLDRFGAQDARGLFEPYILQDRAFREQMEHAKIVFFPEETDMNLVAKEFQELEVVFAASPDWLLPVLDRCPTNDPSLSTQWFLDQIQAEEAWCHEVGDTTILVAAIDSGIDWDHPDLIGNLWVNTGEDAGNDPSGYESTNRDLLFAGATINNNVDDDGNGLVDDFIGWDYVSGASQPHPDEDASYPDNNPLDFNGHGTGVTAAMAEVGNNEVGGAGVAYNAKFLGMRAGYNTSSNQGLILTSAALQAIAYAVDKGANVINMSYGGGGYNGTVASTMNNAWNNGVLLFGAAGNDGVGTAHYPAAYTNVIAVGATDQSDNRAMFSNYGTWVDIAAPGVNCYTAWYNDTYDSWPGTSVASPIAAGVGALVVAAYPDTTNAFRRMVIENTTDEIETDQPLGTGRVNAWKAVTQFRWPRMFVGDITLSDPDGNGHPDPGETIELSLELSNELGWMSAQNVIVTASSDMEEINFTTNGVNVGTVAPGDTITTEANPLVFEIEETAPNGAWASLDLVISADPNDYVIADTARILIGVPDVLLVDDDGGEAYESYLLSDLEEMGETYNPWDTAVQGLPTVEVMQESEIVIWMASTSADPLSADEQSAIEAAYTSGVKFIVSGEGLDEQLAGTEFYSNVLHAESAEGAIPFHGLNAIPGAGGPSVEGHQLVMLGSSGAGNSTDPDVIAPVGGSVAGWSYVGSDVSVGGIYYTLDDRYLVYFPFNLEAVSGDNNSTSRVEALEAIFAWFRGEVSTPDQHLAAMPTDVSIESAYPNPFNPVTTVQVGLPRAAELRVAVYDLLGRRVAVLASGRREAGRHRIRWNAAEQAAGVYLVVMEAAGQRDTRKIVYLK